MSYHLTFGWHRQHMKLIVRESAAGDSNIGLMIRYTFRAFTRALQLVAASHKITAAEFRVLRTLSDGALTQLEIAKLAAMDRPYAASIVRQLRVKRLVRAEPHALDGRRVDLLLTAKGSHIVAAISQHLTQVNKTAVAGVNPRNQAIFLDVLAKIRRNLEPDESVETVDLSAVDP